MTKKQELALENLIIFLDELDNKPRRLFNALVDFNNAFTETAVDKRRITRQIHTNFMTTLQDRIIKDYEKFLIEVTDERKWKNGKPTYNGYVYVTLGNAFKQFLIQSIKEVEEETKGDVLNKLHAMVCDLATDKGKDLAKEDCLELIRYQIERIYRKKLLSITNKEKEK